MATVKKKAPAKPTPKPKPVTVTIAKIAAARPCYQEFLKFLRRVDGRAPQSYVDIETRGCVSLDPRCRVCMQLKRMAKGTGKLAENAPILLAEIYKMKQAWGLWVAREVLSVRDKDRWIRELQRQ